MIANNINESIFDKVKDFFKKKPSVRQATDKEKSEDRYYNQEDRYADEDRYAGNEDRYAGNEDRFTSGRVETREKKLKRWENNPDGCN